MRIKSILGLLICIALVFSLPFTPSANAASAEEEVLQVATNWAKAFSNSDFELISSLHSHSINVSKFTPDKAGAFLTQGWDIIGQDWKETFKENPPGSFTFSLHHQQATLLGNDVAVITQYFTGTYTDPKTKEQTVTGVVRQTFVVQKMSGKWLIVHEHSSNLPIE